jgi:hypothetical protein
MRKTSTPRPRQEMGLMRTSPKALAGRIGRWLSKTAGSAAAAVSAAACASTACGAVFCGAMLGSAVFCTSEEASAQEILLTGPLKGAGSAHDLRLYRKGRVEIAPAASFTLLDEYMRQILVGARINYNLTDFLAIGVWGGFSPNPLKLTTGLSEKIQAKTVERRGENAMALAAGQQPELGNRLTSINLGNNFEDQLGSVDWIIAPQVTFVPFRGKIALFQSIYIDSDLYFFAGPAIAGVKERADCSGPGSSTQGGCSSARASGTLDPDQLDIPIPNAEVFPTSSRIAIAPTFGLGFTFYVNRWNAVGFEWRAVPFARNTGGFDNHGAGPDNDFPDQAVDSDDRDLKLNQMLSVSWNFYLPLDYQVSE